MNKWLIANQRLVQDVLSAVLLVVWLVGLSLAVAGCAGLELQIVVPPLVELPVDPLPVAPTP